MGSCGFVLLAKTLISRKVCRNALVHVHRLLRARVLNKLCLLHTIMMLLYEFVSAWTVRCMLWTSNGEGRDKLVCYTVVYSRM